MPHVPSTCLRWLSATAMTVTLAGCTTGPFAPSPVPDVRPLRQRRSQEAAAAFNSGRDEAQRAAIVSYLDAGDVKAAQKLLETIAQREPDNTEAIALLEGLDDLQSAGAIEPAELESTAPISPPSPPQHASLVLLKQEMLRAIRGGDPQATSVLLTTLDSEPLDRPLPATSSDVEELVRRGTAALMAGAPNAAGDSWLLALQRSPADESLALRLSVDALRHEQPELAVRLAEAALRDCPRSAGLYRVSGAAHYRLADWRSAQNALRQALSLDNAHPLSYFLMGCTLTKLGDSVAAQWHYRQARQRDPRYVLRD